MIRAFTLPATILSVALTLAAPAAAATTDVSPDGDTATTSTAAFPLEGTRWRLSDYRRGGTSRAVAAEVAAWISLAAGKARGSGGCDIIEGRYGTVGERIAIKLTRQDDGSCSEQTMVVERSMIEALNRAWSFEVRPSPGDHSSQLVIFDDSGVETLHFRVDDASSLTASEWRLDAYTSGTEWVPANPLEPAVLTFRSQRRNVGQRSFEGDASGSTGCNGIVGRFFQQASVLSLGRLDLTDAPCSPRAAAQQEAMMAVLDATSLSIELPPDRLLLTSADSDERLEFSSSAPLEGSTWILRQLPGKPDPDEAVTMRLIDSALSGEGPCGSYSGRYETNGVLLSFTDLVGAGSGDCDEARSERRLLAALRRTVLADKFTPGLRLIDAFGRTVARFERPAGP
ncbi:MAG: META domain-containing protein [Chloroflexota bacterium]